MLHFLHLFVRHVYIVKHSILLQTFTLSLTLWKSDGKMSISKAKDVPQLVEKYRQAYPDLDRDLLRKLIRLENKIENPSDLKKLDRYLAKAFKNEVKPSTENGLFQWLSKDDLDTLLKLLEVLK